MSAPLTNVDLSTLTAEERAEYDKAHSLQAFIEAHQVRCRSNFILSMTSIL